MCSKWLLNLNLALELPFAPLHCISWVNIPIWQMMQKREQCVWGTWPSAMKPDLKRSGFHPSIIFIHVPGQINLNTWTSLLQFNELFHSVYFFKELGSKVKVSLAISDCSVSSSTAFLLIQKALSVLLHGMPFLFVLVTFQLLWQGTINW